MARTLVNSVKITPATTTQVGDVVQSMLTEAQFQAERDGTWVLADGRSVTGSKYEIITGNASIPDLRGRFLRGKNNGRSAASGNASGEVALGTNQSDRLGSHGHRIWGKTSASGSYGDALSFPAAGIVGESTVGSNNWISQYVESSGSAETNPRNVTVNFFIKID